MNILTDPRQMRRVRILFMITYMVSYMTRINYGAVILEMVSSTGIKASLLSLALTGSFITYGIGQLVSGYFGDRIQPKKLVALGLSVTVCMNLLIPFCPNYLWMTAVWCVNGMAQSLMWPPIVRLMADLFNEEEYKKTTVIVSWGSSSGTMLIYLLSPLWIAVAGWKAVFVFAAVCGIIMVLVWRKQCPEISMNENTVPAQKNKAADPGSNSLLFNGSQTEARKIKEALQILDVATQQVTLPLFRLWPSLLPLLVQMELWLRFITTLLAQCVMEHNPLPRCNLRI